MVVASYGFGLPEAHICFQFVSQGTHTVVVLLHNPEHTEEIATMEKVAEHYKNVDDILIAKMDMTANDMPGRHAAVRRIVPAVRLYEVSERQSDTACVRLCERCCPGTPTAKHTLSTGPVQVISFFRNT